MSDVSRFRYFLSLDKIIDPSDIHLGKRRINIQNIGVCTNYTFSLYIPSNASLGSWYIIELADADEEIVEENELNNTRNEPLSILAPSSPSLPDLLSLNCSVTPSTTNVGSTVTISLQIQNNSTVDIPQRIRIKYYLSTDNILDAGDKRIAKNRIAGLLAGLTKNKLFQLNLPSVAIATAPVLAFNQKSVNSTSFNEIEYLSNSRNIERISGLSIYPNPTSGHFHVRFKPTSEYSNVLLKVINTLGTVILIDELNFDEGEYSASLDMTNFNSGLYFIVIQLDTEMHYESVILRE